MKKYRYILFISLILVFLSNCMTLKSSVSKPVSYMEDTYNESVKMNYYTYYELYYYELNLFKDIKEYKNSYCVSSRYGDVDIIIDNDNKMKDNFVLVKNKKSILASIKDEVEKVYEDYKISYIPSRAPVDTIEDGTFLGYAFIYVDMENDKDIRLDKVKQLVRILEDDNLNMKYMIIYHPSYKDIVTNSGQEIKSISYRIKNNSEIENEFMVNYTICTEYGEKITKYNIGRDKEEN